MSPDQPSSPDVANSGANSMTEQRTEGPVTEAGREVLASARRVITEVREIAFPHMVGEPIPQDSLSTLVVMAEQEARNLALAEVEAKVAGLLAVADAAQVLVGSIELGDDVRAVGRAASRVNQALAALGYPTDDEGLIDFAEEARHDPQ